jgi:hypothetical protein
MASNADGTEKTAISKVTFDIIKFS